MALTRLIAFADNDVTSDAEAVLTAIMKVPDVAEYDFIGDGPYAETGTKWTSMMSKYFTTDELLDKLRLSQGNHEHPESESKKTQEDIEAWYGRGLKESKWLSAGQRGNVYIIAMNTQDLDVEFKRDQYNWVISKLEEAKKLKAEGKINWIVVLEHKPFFTLKSSHSPYTAVRKIYNDPFIDAGVDFVIAGHNHNTQFWYPMKVDFSTEANGLGIQFFEYAADGKTFNFAKPHGPAYIVTGHAGHEWNGINDSGEGVKNVQFFNDTGKFGFTQLDFTEEQAIVQSIDTDGKVLFEYKVTKSGNVPIPTQDPIAKIAAQSQAQVGTKVTLDTSGSANFDELEITQTEGETVQLTNTNGKIEFTAPNTEQKLTFQAKAIKGDKSSTAQVSIQITKANTPPPTGDETKLIPVTIGASSADIGKEASKAADGNFETRWSANGDGQWIEFKFDKAYPITKVKLTGYHYDKTYKFEINGKQFENSAGRPIGALVEYDLRDLKINSDKVRIIGHGNSATTYNSYREIEFYTGTITDPKHCKPGYHWDEDLKKCIPDLEPPVNPDPDPDPVNPVAKLLAPSSIKGGQTVELDGSQSIADTLDITQTSGQAVSLIDIAKFKKQFVAPSGNFQLAFQAVAKKGTKSSITQVSIQVTTQGPDPDPDGDIDEHGIKWLVAKGKKTIVTMSRDEAADDRWSGNVKGLFNGFEATFIGKSTGTNDSSHFAMKQFSGNHSGSGSEKNAWYDTGLRVDGEVQLQTEFPHPNNNDFDLPDANWFIKKISKGLEGNWIGLKWCVMLVKPNGTRKDGIRCRMWVDEDPLDANNKPKNNWKLVYDFVDKGQIIPADKQLVDEQDCEVRRSDTDRHDIYGDGKVIENAQEGAPGLHVRPL